MRLVPFSLTYTAYDGSADGFVISAITLSPIHIIVTLVIFSLLTILWGHRIPLKKKRILLLTLGLLMSSLLNAIIKRIIKHPRPTNSHRGGYGMPSDHAQCNTQH